MRVPDSPNVLDLSVIDPESRIPADPPSRALVPIEPTPTLVKQGRAAPEDIVDVDIAALPPPSKEKEVNVRHLTPREMQEYSLDLYAAGHISFDDYEALAFQPELQPAYNRTIGALTGEPARPDQPRDFLAHWESRLDFTRRYFPESAPQTRQAARIVGALSGFQTKTDIFA